MTKKAYIEPAVTVFNIQLKDLLISSVEGAEGLGKGDDWSSGSANARGFEFDGEF